MLTVVELVRQLRQRLCRHDWDIEMPRALYLAPMPVTVFRRCRKCRKREYYMTLGYDDDGSAW